ncbi:MAG: C39 family peptidase [DPANN group archaeon]|nr:C39 family peptidase [DPANN group archaeon]
MKICLHKQQTKWTCGPACMRMALEACGIERNETQVAKLMRANSKIGVLCRAFPKVAERFKLNYVSLRNAKISDIKNLLKKGFVIIISYFLEYEEITHTAVVSNVTKNYIYLLDPWYGKKAYWLKHFGKIWRDRLEGERHWLFALKPAD